MWTDLQETFFIVLGPFLVYLALPLFLAGIITIAALMPLVRFRR